jgi:geranylgeranyl diphosphate synthase, type II
MSSEQADARRLRVSPQSRRLLGQLHERAHRAVMLSLPSGEPRPYLYDLLPQYPQRSGKGLRPVLCTAACEAFGGSNADALPFAAALELLHNAFLVHDDIQDGSERRRGRAALHVEHGTPLALNAGDALAARANATFVRAAQAFPPPLARALLEGWERMIHETLEGQATDLGWQRDNVVDMSIADYLDMCGKKTAWYTFIHPLAIGAIVGSGRPERAHDTFGFGWLLGLLYQIVNDLDGVSAPPGETDVDEGKRTMLLIHLLETLNGPDREEVVRVMGLSRAKRTKRQVRWVLSQMNQAGSIDHARACVLELAYAARDEADEAFGSLPPSDARGLLLSVTGLVLEQGGFVPSGDRAS